MNKSIVFRWMTGCLLAICLLLPAARMMAQAPETLGSAEIFLRLKKLNVLGSVLYI
jgi:hypothetical protein